MVNTINRLSVATAIGAVLLPFATPAMAADLPRPAAATAFQTYDADAGNTAERSRRDYRGGRYDRYDRYDRYRDRDRGIDTGTAIAGALVLGSLAAILIDSNNKRDRQPEPEPYPYPEDARYNGNSGYSQAPAYPGGPVPGDYGSGDYSGNGDYYAGGYGGQTSGNQYDEATYARLRQQQNGSYNGY